MIIEIGAYETGIILAANGGRTNSGSTWISIPAAWVCTIPLAYFAFSPILNGHRFRILQIWVKCLTNVSSSSEIWVIWEYLLLYRMDIGETDWAVHFACLGCWCAVAGIMRDKALESAQKWPG